MVALVKAIVATLALPFALVMCKATTQEPSLASQSNDKVQTIFHLAEWPWNVQAKFHLTPSQLILFLQLLQLQHRLGHVARICVIAYLVNWHTPLQHAQDALPGCCSCESCRIFATSIRLPCRTYFSCSFSSFRAQKLKYISYFTFAYNSHSFAQCLINYQLMCYKPQKH